MKKDEPLCKALERTYMVSLIATVLAAPSYYPIFEYILQNLWTEYNQLKETPAGTAAAV